MSKWVTAGYLIIIMVLVSLLAWSVWAETRLKEMPINVNIVSNQQVELCSDSLANEGVPISSWYLSDLKRGTDFTSDFYLRNLGEPITVGLRVEGPSWIKVEPQEVTLDVGGEQKCSLVASPGFEIPLGEVKASLVVEVLPPGGTE